MSLFDQINARFSENLQHHGHYLTDPHASNEEKIAETVDIDIIGDAVYQRMLEPFFH